MAYDPTFPPALIAQGIGGAEGMRWYGFTWGDDISIVLGAGYITDADRLGLRVGDSVRYSNINAMWQDAYGLVVSAIDPVTGAATLAFPEMPQEALPESGALAPDVDYVAVFQGGAMKRMAVLTLFGDYLTPGDLAAVGIQPNAQGPLALRDDYDGAAPPFIFLSTSGNGVDATRWYLYEKKSAASGDWSAGTAVGRGDVGGPGPDGPSGTITGASATGLPAGSEPTVTLGGTPSARTFAFGLPAGATGDPGEQGIQGYGGWTPILSMEPDGERRVQRIVGWAGGGGPEPAAGAYIGPAGPVATPAEATNVRGPAGPGDMNAATYDPTGKAADAFAMDNMTEGTATKIMTATERTKLAGIATGAQVNAVTTVAGRTGAVTLAVADVSGAAPLASPALTGNPTAATQAAGNNSTRIATTAYADAAAGLKLAKASNLSDLANAATARTNLGLGTAAQSAATDFATTAQGAKADTAVQPGALGTAAAKNTGTTAGTVPLLDGSGLIPSALLPSYVDDVIEAANFAALPGTGETGKIYVTLDTNKTYRWSGSAYVEISASPGSTDAVTEGATNLYFTAARVRSTLLAGLSLVTGGAIAATDSVLAAFGKLQKQVTDLAASAFSGAFADLTGKPTTLGGYGITDAATSTQGATADAAQPKTSLLTSFVGLTVAAGDIIYATAANTLARLAKGTDGHVLTLASGIPSWAAPAGGGQPIPTSSSFAVGTLAFLYSTSATSCANGATIAGTSLKTAIFGGTGGVVTTIGTAQSGTWRNVSGGALSTTDGYICGHWVRTA